MIKREMYLEKIRNLYDSELIKVITGIRRCGKSVLLMQIMEELKEKGINLKSLVDLNINIEIEENGKDSIENAIIKAKGYYEFAKIPTIGMDNSLFIEGIADSEQPGTHVRRINGKRLTDKEMIEYYTRASKKI